MIKFLVKVGDASSKLRILTDVLPSKSLVPAYEAIYFQHKGSSLTMTASDSELIARERIAVESDSKVLTSFAVPGRVFCNLISSFPSVSNVEVQVNLEGGSGKVTLKQRGSKYKVSIIADYPLVYSSNPKKVIQVTDVSEFRKVLKRLLVTISRDEIKPVLGGCNIEFHSKMIEMASSDTQRLTLSELKNKNSYSSDPCIIPLKCISVLERHLNSNKPLTISFQDDYVRFENGFLLYSLLINGQFPNLKPYVPKTFENEVSVSAVKLKQVLDRLSVISIFPDIMNVRVEKEHMSLSIDDPENVNDGDDRLKVETKNGVAVDFNLNLNNLREVLSNFGSESSVRFLFSKMEGEPVTIVDSELPITKTLIQPICD